MKKLILSFLISYCAFLIAQVGVAQVIHVPADQPTIQAGIDAAVTGDTVLVADGTYLENINYNGKAITVASHFLMNADTNHINNTVIDGSQPANPDYGSVVTFITGEDTTSVLLGFTITGGTGTLMIMEENVRIGGGVLCYYANARIVQNKIIHNECIDDNEALGGGVGYINLEGDNWSVIENNIISENMCTGNEQAAGGGIFSSNNIRIVGNVIENNIVTGTNAGGMGGGIHTQGTGDDISVLLLDNTIRNNVVLSDDLARGGGLFSIANSIIMKNNIIYHDSLSGYGSYGGGALIWNSSYAEIQGNTISHNIVNKLNAYWGAGLFLSAPLGPVKVSDNEILYNMGEHTSTGAGGGLSFMDAFDYPVIVDGNLFLENSGYHGAAFYERNSYNLKITNNRFISNHSYRAGAIGAYHSLQGSEYRPQIVNNTFWGNSGTNDAGAIRFTGDYMSAPLIMNCIFWENEAPDGKDIRNWSTDIMYVYYSDIDVNMMVGPWSGDENFFEDPGFTDEDCHIDPASPCFDVGGDSLYVAEMMVYPPSHDFEGSLRPFNLGFDVGADEWDNIGFAEFRIQNSEFKIEVYPNPTHGIVNCQLSVVDCQWFSLKIYDVHCREVAMVLDEMLPAGEHVVQYDMSGLPAGIYLVRLQAGEAVATGKLVISR